MHVLGLGTISACMWHSSLTNRLHYCLFNSWYSLHSTLLYYYDCFYSIFPRSSVVNHAMIKVKKHSRNFSLD